MILSGSTLWSPLASVLAVGLVCSMVFTLVVVPVLFVMVERRAERGAQPSVVTPVTKPHLTHSPATLEPAAMGAATALVVGALLALAVPGPMNAQSPAMQARNSVVLTLDEAITMATSNSRLSRMAGETVSEKAAAARGARAELFPRVSFDAITVTSNANTSFEVPRGSLGTDGLGTPIPNVARRVDQDGASLVFAGLMVSQPLTPLFRIAEGSRVARAALGESEAERATTELDLALAAEKLYVGVLMAERRRDAAHAMVVARRAVCADAERAVSAGVSVDARVSEARASELEAEQALMTASHAAEDARAALNELLGLPLDAASALAVPPAPSPVDDLASQVTVAARQRPEIAAASAKVDQARHAKDAARTEYIPDVSVFVRQSYQDAVAYVPTNNFSAGVQAKWNVLDFGRRIRAGGPAVCYAATRRGGPCARARSGGAGGREGVPQCDSRGSARGSGSSGAGRQAGCGAPNGWSGGGGRCGLRCGSGGGRESDGGGECVTRGRVGGACGTCGVGARGRRSEFPQFGLARAVRAGRRQRTADGRRQVADGRSRMAEAREQIEMCGAPPIACRLPPHHAMP
jgi:outer membrane protein TolC